MSTQPQTESAFIINTYRVGVRRFTIPHHRDGRNLVFDLNAARELCTSWNRGEEPTEYQRPLRRDELLNVGLRVSLMESVHRAFSTSGTGKNKPVIFIKTAKPG